ncbi:MAG: aminotransferase class I/II-fold pyridoxal phosphate-dependent enzyme [Lentimicrobium sp.]|jgi:threonine aldolase|nr:aminotransferase class I/II-fold pyridoxal phosphate-dependent enzyme [Lentimicrobium sp.]MDY0026462.1 GntG family PLP-dependent aldolase [Lentimicrobium sp.]
MKIDLRSDTVTRPTPAMMQAMFLAKVGDDVFEEDPTINELEEKAAVLFGMEAGLFCASGTMTNQIAVNVHTRPGDEVILHKLSHLYYYEGGGMMRNSGVSVCLLEGERGMITAEDVENHINPADDVHRPLTTMVAVENTMNKGGGAVYDFNELLKIGEVARKHSLAYHMDGARIFNALAVTEQNATDYGKLFDSISVCFSKGLGAPVGSVLLGSKDFIYKARRIRKVFGGGMRQAGYLAAAAIYALDHNLERLNEDHRKAKVLAAFLSELNWVDEVLPVDTNILIFKTRPGLAAADVVKKLASAGLLCMDFDKQSIRMVTHLDFTDEMLEETLRILRESRSY